MKTRTSVRVFCIIGEPPVMQVYGKLAFPFNPHYNKISITIIMAVYKWQLNYV